MAIKLEIKNLYKIFGEHPQRAFKYIEKGFTKEHHFDGEVQFVKKIR